MFSTPSALFTFILWILAATCLVVLLFTQLLKVKSLEKFLDPLAKSLLISGTTAAFCILLELLIYAITHNETGRYMVLNVVFGKSLFWIFWVNLFCIGIIVQPLWLLSIRQNRWCLGIISIMILISIRLPNIMLITLTN